MIAVRLASALIGLLGVIVPASLRGRWREEWRAEIAHAAEARVGSHFAPLRTLRMAAGAVPDALAARRLARANSLRLAGRRGRFLHASGQDWRYAWRTLAATPGVALGVVASLSLGIAANTTAFSVVNAALLRPFAGVHEQDALVGVRLSRLAARGGSDISSSYGEFRTLAEGLSSLSSLAAVHRTEFAVTFADEPVALSGALVSGNYFQTLGMRPAAGRFFAPEEDATPRAHGIVVISDDAWRRHFDRDPAVIGGVVLVNGRDLRVVGVTPRGFIGTHKGSAIQIWVPFAISELALRDAERRPVHIASAGPLWFEYIGRRQPGISLEQVAAQAATLTRALDAAREPERRGLRSQVVRVRLNDPANNLVAVTGFMAVPLLVLAVSCVNAANLLLANASRRRRDWHLRLALGASRWRVVRQVLAEALLLAGFAGLAGIGISIAALRLIESAFPMPFSFPLDWRVLLFTSLTALLTAIGCGIGPALHVSSQRAARASASARLATRVSRSRTRFALIAVQAALSLGLLATGVQFIRTLSAAVPSEAPQPERLFIASFDLDPLQLDRQSSDEFYARLRHSARAVPGVTAAGVSLPGMLVGRFDPAHSMRIWIADSAPDEGRPQLGGTVEGDYFSAAGIPLLAGRDFAVEDASRPIRSVIVTETLARRREGELRLGRTFRVAPAGFGSQDAVDVAVVGVVAGEWPLVYLPAPIAHTPARSLYVRTAAAGQFTRETVQRIVSEIDPRVPIREAATLAQMQNDRNFEQKLLARGVAILGLFALVLAAGGLFSVVSYLVALRRHEIGVRMALGASGLSVTGLILRQALMPALLGALLGAGGAAAAGLIIRSRLHGAAPVDPLALTTAAALMLTAAAIATIVPARHAARVDPMLVLRED